MITIMTRILERTQLQISSTARQLETTSTLRWGSKERRKRKCRSSRNGSSLRESDPIMIINPQHLSSLNRFAITSLGLMTPSLMRLTLWRKTCSRLFQRWNLRLMLWMEMSRAWSWFFQMWSVTNASTAMMLTSAEIPILT